MVFELWLNRVYASCIWIVAAIFTHHSSSIPGANPLTTAFTVNYNVCLPLFTYVCLIECYQINSHIFHLCALCCVKQCVNVDANKIPIAKHNNDYDFLMRLIKCAAVIIAGTHSVAVVQHTKTFHWPVSPKFIDVNKTLIEIAIRIQ